MQPGKTRIDAILRGLFEGADEAGLSEENKECLAEYRADEDARAEGFADVADKRRAEAEQVAAIRAEEAKVAAQIAKAEAKAKAAAERKAKAAAKADAEESALD